MESVHCLSLVLVAISVNIDNFLVGIAYGTREIHIGYLGNLLIAVITSVGTAMSMLVGDVVMQFISVETSNILGSLILIAMSCWVMKDFFFKKVTVNKDPNQKTFANELLDDPEKADADHSGSIELRESIVLAFALTLNNFGLGLGASISMLNLQLTVICSFFFSIISLWIGLKLGNRCASKYFGKYAPLLSGLLILVLGIYELVV